MTTLPNAPGEPTLDETTPHVVVVGAGLAGLRTVERLRRSGHEGPITWIGEEDRIAYDRPPLSKAVLVSEDEPVLPVLRPEEKYDELDAVHHRGRPAVGLDLERREVRLDDDSAVTYDVLVIATGARARLAHAWSAVPGTHVLRTFDDAVAIRSALRSARSAVVIGAGVLGCEIAASARKLGVDVDVVDPLPRPLARVVPAEVSSAVVSLHEEHGVQLRLGVGVDALHEGDARPRITLSDATVLEPDVVVVAIGSIPNTEWLDGSGLEVEDGVACDSDGRTSDPHVWAVGDIARHTDERGSIRLEHWTSAGDSAARVVARILGQEPFGAIDVPYFWSDQFDAKIQTLGLPSTDDDLQVVAGSIEERKFLAVLSREGAVTAAVGISMPAAVMRCRQAIEQGEALSSLLERAPWQPKKKVTA